jgi:Ca2+-binding EF-hand superfamily protein
MHTLFKAFDRNNDGVINFDEFLRSIRDELPKARMDLIKQAFQKLDRD